MTAHTPDSSSMRNSQLQVDNFVNLYGFDIDLSSNELKAYVVPIQEKKSLVTNVVGWIILIYCLRKRLSIFLCTRESFLQLHTYRRSVDSSTHNFVFLSLKGHQQRILGRIGSTKDQRHQRIMNLETLFLTALNS